MVHHEQLSNFLLGSFDAKSLKGCVVVRDNALVRSDPYQRNLHGRGFEEESTHSRSTASVSLHSLPSLSSDGSVSRWDSCGSRPPANNNDQRSPSQNKPRVPHRTDSGDKDVGSLALQPPRNRRRSSISNTSIASSSTDEENHRPLRRPTRRRSIDVSEPGEPSIVVQVPMVRRAPLRRNSLDNHGAWIHNASSSSRSSNGASISSRSSNNTSTSSRSSGGDSLSKLQDQYRLHHCSAPTFHLPPAPLHETQSSNHARHQRSILNTIDLFPRQQQQQQPTAEQNEENEHSESTDGEVPVVVVQTRSQ